MAFGSFSLSLSANTVPHNGSDASLVRFSCVLKNVEGNLLACWRRDKDWVVVAVFCGMVVSAKHVGYVTRSEEHTSGLQSQ